MLDLLRSRRWLAFTAAALGAILLFGLLSMWQYHRAEDKRAEFAVIAARTGAAPSLPAYDDASTALDWQRIELRGTYDPDAQLLIRNHPQDGSNGFWVASLLDTAQGATWVVRGWLPATVGPTAPVPPPPPTGEVAVDGYARTPEAGPARRADDVPAGQATALAPEGLSDLVGSAQRPSSWYVLSAHDASLRPVAMPQPDDSRNLSYAGQWLLFAVITIGGWGYFLRREAAESAEVEDSGTGATGSAAGGRPPGARSATR